MINKLKEKARKLKHNITALYLLSKDKLLKWPVQILVIITVGYALSPIDLIPDFIPILGYLDDLIILPLLITLTLKLIPKPLINEYILKAKTLEKKPKNWIAGFIFILIWIVLIFALLKWLI
ncbi:MAG: DUF1232 domain-containing protein [Clostridiales bacterium]|nr:DUF1232 domain-containing protein [Clostridiales bacterium]